MEFNNTKVMNFENAILGMRNSRDSRNKSDSQFGLKSIKDVLIDNTVCNKWTVEDYECLISNTDSYQKELSPARDWLLQNEFLSYDSHVGCAEIAELGPADLKLAQNLVRAGSEHSKFMRQIFVSVDITAPLYWWKEADQYKIGVTTDSASTMNNLSKLSITKDCFEISDYKEGLQYNDEHTINTYVNQQIDFLEGLRIKYLETNDTRYWKELVRWLPESWLQMRTWTGSYANLRDICYQREGHKLTEWSLFITWVKTLPYAKELILLDK